MKMNRILIALTLAVLASALSAQPKGKPIDVAVQSVNDRRTNGRFFNNLTISVELPKVQSSEVAASRVLVASAVDNKGNNLLDPEAREPQLEVNHRMTMGGSEAAPATVSIVLENPDRKATTVKEVRGEIELYMPSKDPNSIGEVPQFLSFSGKPITHKALKANGVEIAVVSPAQIEAERKRLADAKRKEYKDTGVDAETLESIVTQFMEYTLKFEEGDVALRIKDPNQRIQEIVYIDSAGEVQRASMNQEEGITKLTMWGEKPKADWKLRVSMRTPKNLVRHAFALNDVPLP